jgi:hypothetical protein
MKNSNNKMTQTYVISFAVGFMLSITISTISICQKIDNNIGMLQGFWQPTHDKNTFLCYEKQSLYYMTIYFDDDVSVISFIIGFSDDCEIKSINDVKERGQYFFRVSSWDFLNKNRMNNIKCFTFDMNDNRLLIYDHPEQPIYYKKINNLPKNVESALNKWKQTHKDYLKEFNIPEPKNSPQIITPKAFLYSSPADSTIRKAYLIKGDKVAVLEEKADWLYVEYQGKKTIKAWLKRKDVEILK